LTNVVIRADASASIGAGHAMRCLALAQAWIDRGADVHWLATELLPSCRNRIAAEGIHVALQRRDAPEEEDALRTEQFAAAVAADWVVLDGYSFGARHQATLKQAGRRVLFIDDHGHADRYTADIVLNQNIYANDTLYAEKAGGAIYLLGPRNALLRREFRDAGSVRETRAQALNLLVMFGGAGDAAHASLILEALRRLAPRRRFQVHLVLGSAVRAEDVVDDRTDEWLTVSQFVGDMPAALACADMAVSAAGSTVYELMTAGVPSLVVAVAENQRANARRLSQLGLAINLGFAGSLEVDAVAGALDGLAADALTRASMSAKGRETVDGQGAVRVQTLMEAGLIQLRCAAVDDMRMIWHWANDASVRAVSFSTDPIPWEDHVRWFGARLRDPRHRMLIAEAPGGAAVGGVRMELAGEHAVISVTIDRGSRGVGYGRWLIRLASLHILQDAGVTDVHAYIKPDNTGSIRAFECAGFRFHSRTMVRNQPAMLFAFRPAVAGGCP
jgi:UDP-2,4-diacetamido-2,4,6-trideoxy-beta-L-altropyranose hydrolase